MAERLRGSLCYVSEREAGGKGKTGAGLSGVGDIELGFELRTPSAATAGRQELLLGAVAGCERKELDVLKAGFSNLSLVDLLGDG